MDAPMMAESSSKRKKGPKILDHLRIKRDLKGGHVIEHHYTNYEHEPKPYKFEPHEAHRAAAHVMRHAGLPMPEGSSEAEKMEQEEKE